MLVSYLWISIGARSHSKTQCIIFGSLIAISADYRQFSDYFFVHSLHVFKDNNIWSKTVTKQGGWPNSIRMKPNAALQVATNYTESVINMDVNRVDGVEKNPERVRLLLRSLARNISTLTTGQTILADIEATDLTISDKTLTQYLNALRRIYVIEDVPAWQPSLRSKSAIRTTHKRGFVDPSIATAVLRASFLMVLTGGEFAYRREDGVLVVPIGCMRD